MNTIQPAHVYAFMYASACIYCSECKKERTSDQLNAVLRIAPMQAVNVHRPTGATVTATTDAVSSNIRRAQKRVYDGPR